MESGPALRSLLPPALPRRPWHPSHREEVGASLDGGCEGWDDQQEAWDLGLPESSGILLSTHFCLGRRKECVWGGKQEATAP